MMDMTVFPLTLRRRPPGGVVYKPWCEARDMREAIRLAANEPKGTSIAVYITGTSVRVNRWTVE